MSIFSAIHPSMMPVRDTSLDCESWASPFHFPIRFCSSDTSSATLVPPAIPIAARKPLLPLGCPSEDEGISILQDPHFAPTLLQFWPYPDTALLHDHALLDRLLSMMSCTPDAKLSHLSIDEKLDWLKPLLPAPDYSSGWTPCLNKTMDASAIASMIAEESSRRFRDIPFQHLLRQALGYETASVENFLSFFHHEVPTLIVSHIGSYQDASKYESVKALLRSERNPLAYMAVQEGLVRSKGSISNYFAKQKGLFRSEGGESFADLHTTNGGFHSWTSSSADMSGQEEPFSCGRPGVGSDQITAHAWPAQNLSAALTFVLDPLRSVIRDPDRSLMTKLIQLTILARRYQERYEEEIDWTTAFPINIDFYLSLINQPSRQVAELIHRADLENFCYLSPTGFESNDEVCQNIGYQWNNLSKTVREGAMGSSIFACKVVKCAEFLLARENFHSSTAMLQGLMAANREIPHNLGHLMRADGNYRALRDAMAERKALHGFIPLLIVCRREYQLNRQKSAAFASLCRGTPLSDRRFVPISNSVETKARETSRQSGRITGEEEDDDGWLCVWRGNLCGWW